jgi:hypothetical protein
MHFTVEIVASGIVHHTRSPSLVLALLPALLLHMLNREKLASYSTSVRVQRRKAS